MCRGCRKSHLSQRTQGSVSCSQASSSAIRHRFDGGGAYQLRAVLCCDQKSITCYRSRSVTRTQQEDIICRRPAYGRRHEKTRSRCDPKTGSRNPKCIAWTCQLLRTWITDREWRKV